MTTKTAQPASASAPQQALSVPEAARLKSVSPDTIRRAIRSTERPFLRAKKVGGRVRISLRDLEEWWDQLPDA